MLNGNPRKKSNYDYLSLEPGLLGPKTIYESNFYTIFAKCFQIETKNQTTLCV